MGQAKQRGTFEERRELAKKNYVLKLEQSNQEEIELAQKMVKITIASLFFAKDSFGFLPVNRRKITRRV